MKKTITTLIAIITLIAMAYMGKQGYRAAIQYEQTTLELTQRMDASALAQQKLLELANLLSLGLIENDTKEVAQKLEQKRQIQRDMSREYALYFAILAVVVLTLYFVLSLQSFTIIISTASLIALINGLVTPIMMMTIHKEVEFLGDVVLSFESKGILGSISKLYGQGSIVVASIILLFSVLLPFAKTLAMLFISIFEFSPFAVSVVRFFKHLGKWSMIDVFVVAIFLVYLTSNDSDVSHAEVEIGLYFFVVYVLLSIVTSLSADKLLHDKTANL